MHGDKTMDLKWLSAVHVHVSGYAMYLLQNITYDAVVIQTSFLIKIIKVGVILLISIKQWIAIHIFKLLDFRQPKIVNHFIYIHIIMCPSIKGSNHKLSGGGGRSNRGGSLNFVLVKRGDTQFSLLVKEGSHNFYMENVSKFMHFWWEIMAVLNKFLDSLVHHLPFHEALTCVYITA